MKKFVLALAALSLGSCAPGLLAGLGTAQAPAPLARTVIDDKGLETAWKAFDLSLDALNTLGDLGYIKPGSPTGKSVAAAIRKTNTALAAAERFAAAGSATDYANALAEASEGISAIRDLIKGSM